MFFLHISNRMLKNVKRCETLDWKSTFTSGVKCILGQYSLRPSVNLSCDYEILFHDSQHSYLQWEECLSKCLSFTFCFWILASATNTFFMYMQTHKLRLETWSSFSFLLESYRGLELSLPSLRRTVLLLTSSGMRFRHCSSVAYAENFHGGFLSVAYGGHLHLLFALCDVTIWCHIHLSKTTFWRSLLT